MSVYFIAMLKEFRELPQGSFYGLWNTIQLVSSEDDEVIPLVYCKCILQECSILPIKDRIIEDVLTLMEHKYLSDASNHVYVYRLLSSLQKKLKEFTAISNTLKRILKHNHKTND